jgi:signal peptide peptidase SppA
MSILNILSGQWAIDPPKLIEIQNIYAGHKRGDKVDIAALEAKIGRKLDNQSASYTIEKGVAVISLDGIIAKRMNMMTQISGGTSSQLVALALEDAKNNPAVKGILLAIDSPGGTVDGTQALADAVFAARSGGKPIATLASGCMCSAAYWIGSAAQAVYIADATTMVGSIGVVTSHTDISGAEAAQGLKTTEITAGKYKRIASQYGPLTADGRKSIQDQLDYTYSIFVDAVAKNRNAAVSTVVSKMADGKTFMGQQAVDAGLVDGICTLEDLISRMAKGEQSKSPLIPARADVHTKAQLAEAAKAHMLTNPGMDFVTAVKHVQGDRDYGSYTLQ